MGREVLRVVYRVEHPHNGRGPYQGDIRGWFPREAIPEHYSLQQYYPGPSMTYGLDFFGCRSMGALRRWFGRRTMRVLKAHGFRVYRLVVSAAEDHPRGQRTFRWSDVRAVEVLS